MLEHNDLERNVRKLVNEDFPSLVLDNQKRIENVGRLKPHSDLKKRAWLVILLS